MSQTYEQWLTANSAALTDEHAGIPEPRPEFDAWALLKWLGQFETATGDRNSHFFQRVFSRGNRKAWVSRNHGQWSHHEAQTGDMKSSRDVPSETEDAALTAVATWLRDAQS